MGAGGRGSAPPKRTAQQAIRACGFRTAGRQSSAQAAGRRPTPARSPARAATQGRTSRGRRETPSFSRPGGAHRGAGPSFARSETAVWSAADGRRPAASRHTRDTHDVAARAACRADDSNGTTGGSAECKGGWGGSGEATGRMRDAGRLGQSGADGVEVEAIVARRWRGGGWNGRRARAAGSSTRRREGGARFREIAAKNRTGDAPATPLARPASTAAPCDLGFCRSSEGRRRAGAPESREICVTTSDFCSYLRFSVRPRTRARRNRLGQPGIAAAEAAWATPRAAWRRAASRAMQRTTRACGIAVLWHSDSPTAT